MVLLSHPKLAGWRLFLAARIAPGVAPILISVLLPALALCQTVPAASEPAQDPAAIVRRAVAKRLAEESRHPPLRFALHRKDERHDITRDVIETPQGDVAMVVASNGAPLSPEDRQAQIARLQNLAAHPDLQAHRQKREQEDAARVDKLMRLLPEAFVYRYIGADPCNPTYPPDVFVPGAPRPAPTTPAPAGVCYHMSFTPNPGFDPPDAEARILRGMAGDIWIAQAQERLYRLHAHIISEVDFGWGIVGRLDKGGTIDLEQTDIGNNDWELTRMKLDLTGKILMVKSLSVQIDEEMGRFSRVPPNLDYRQAIRMLEASRSSGESLASN